MALRRRQKDSITIFFQTHKMSLRDQAFSLTQRVKTYILTLNSHTFLNFAAAIQPNFFH